MRVQTLHVPGSPQIFDLTARWENDASSDVRRASKDTRTGDAPINAVIAIGKRENTRREFV